MAMKKSLRSCAQWRGAGSGGGQCCQPANRWFGLPSIGIARFTSLARLYRCDWRLQQHVQEQVYDPSYRKDQTKHAQDRLCNIPAGESEGELASLMKGACAIMHCPPLS
eukprot:scaffold265066_cov38-Tisochrysis_lutea.AAC.1